MKTGAVENMKYHKIFPKIKQIHTVKFRCIIAFYLVFCHSLDCIAADAGDGGGGAADGGGGAADAGDGGGAAYAGDGGGAADAGD